MIARLMGLKTIAPDALHRLLQSPGQASVLDVNSRESWTTARIPGARHLDPETYQDGELPSDRNGMLVFYCSGPLCRKAPNAARRAQKLGYANVHVLSAGISGWRAAKLPTDSGE